MSERKSAVARVSVAAGSHATSWRRLAQLGSEAMLHMMLVDSFIHSDLHPGELEVQL